MNMRVLITVPDLSLTGGVTALYNVLRLEDYYKNISYFNVNGNLPAFFRIPLKYFLFIIKLSSVDVVHLNPSLNRKSFLRDAVFAWLTILFSKKLVVYWHGWENSYEERIIKEKFLNWIARKSFLKAQTTIVLGTIFEKKIRHLGFKNKIAIETGCVDNIYKSKPHAKIIPVDKPIILLFLSRLEKEKGIYIVIDTLRELNKTEKKFKLIVTGTGSETDKVKKIIKEGDEEIELVGYVSEEMKHTDLLQNSHILFFPTNYPEGLPLSILEGITYGLPIISRPVGGISDIVKNGENGYLFESLEPKVYIDKILEISKDPVLFKQLSLNNIEKSKLFSPQIVRERLFNIYNTVYNG
jgi:glycosyltransferase involved in cell wall biosynthesis